MSILIAVANWPWVDEDYVPVSDSSSTMRRTWRIERNLLRRSASDWLPAIEGALRDIRHDCGNAGWDGQGASPVRDRTIELAGIIAASLFDALPRGTPTPDIIPESDGEICISWAVDAKRVFSLSVGEHGKINFAGQFGGNGGVHAWQRLDTENRYALHESLRDVARYIERLFTPAAG